MARAHTQDDVDIDIEIEAGEELTAAAAAADDTGTESGGRYVMIVDPETGEQIKRVDWIRKVFQQEGGPFYGDRGAIAKKLTEMQGKKVPYQIVFAATKDLKHIKKPAAEPAAEAEAEVAVDAEG
jgi:hypothetical protein